MKTKPVVTAELHELYQKHEYCAISEHNSILYCRGCGSWVCELNRDNNHRSPNKVELLARDFGDQGPYELRNVMKLLGPEDRLSLVKYLKAAGFGKHDAKRRAELETYLNKEAAV